MLQLLGTSDLLQPVSFALVAIFLILLYKWSSASATTANNSLPPSPPKLPIIGNFHQLGLHPHRSLLALSKRHGPLMLLHFGSVPVLVVSSAEAAREIMKTHDIAFSNRPKSTIYEKLAYNYKDIATAPYGEYWRQMKSICVLNLLSNKMVRSFRAVREEETQHMINKIKDSCSILSSSSSSSSVLNLREMFVTLTNDVICRVALGSKYSGEEGGKMSKEIIKEFVELLGTTDIGDYIPWLSWLSHVNGLHAKIDKVAKQFDDFLESVVQEHIDQMSKSGNDERVHVENKEQKDFVDILLGIQEGSLAGFSLDRVGIKALILDMFIAGTDTTSATLVWTMAELIRNPRILRKAQDEVREVLKGKRKVEETDLSELVYLKLVLKESFRLHPPAPLLLPRETLESCTIEGYEIPANTMVFVLAKMVGSDPKCWENPKEFLPERFMDSSVDYKGNHFELLPFGAGRRGCPGMNFAAKLIELALANLLYCFDWELPHRVRREDMDMEEAAGLTVAKKVPLFLAARPAYP
ncbi:cytochrome P450 71A3-like [Pyrus ussuriensis x Pyrus communis]|uniref:Cytochrome P450 71A3-like n=1 Tax=Pyrus ussuriensis x Pyrus communis TaxID=2448454 RepID=A0A5N5ICY3_9ROSA|nr:cytochrome P450 71A3-like [Pyrus ussuriensis x Pyrus communis]